jgi:hypothetical protein
MSEWQREMLIDLIKYGGYWEASKAQRERMIRIIYGDGKSPANPQA